MDRDLAARLPCVVCGIETKRHTGWFLVVENRWLDRLRVLSWHPVLARRARMQSVCGEEHLKTLLTHWLTHANLQFLAAGPSHWAGAGMDCRAEADAAAFFMGEAVGELAVDRESRSRLWTGSAEALECILNALIGGMETQPRPPEFRLPQRAPEYSWEYALH